MTIPIGIVPAAHNVKKKCDSDFQHRRNLLNLQILNLMKMVIH